MGEGTAAALRAHAESTQAESAQAESAQADTPNDSAQPTRIKKRRAPTRGQVWRSAPYFATIRSGPQMAALHPRCDSSAPARLPPNNRPGGVAPGRCAFPFGVVYRAPGFGRSFMVDVGELRRLRQVRAAEPEAIAAAAWRGGGVR